MHGSSSGHRSWKLLCFCRQGLARFDGRVMLLNSQLMSEEEYNAGVLADVQQARQIVAAFLNAESFRGLLHNVSLTSAMQINNNM